MKLARSSIFALARSSTCHKRPSSTLLEPQTAWISQMTLSLSMIRRGTPSWMVGHRQLVGADAAPHPPERIIARFSNHPENYHRNFRTEEVLCLTRIAT